MEHLTGLAGRPCHPSHRSGLPRRRPALGQSHQLRRWILDWESWGTAPAGYDAALLHAVSLLQPETAEQVHATFADVLAGLTGAVAQLAAAAKLLRLVEHGDHSDLAAPLHQHARTLLATYF